MTGMATAAPEARALGRRLAPLARRLAAAGAAGTLVPSARAPALALGVLAALFGLAAVIAVAVMVAGTRLAAGDAAAETATLSILADEAEVEMQARAALAVLRDTQGVESLRVIEAEEQRALLAPWLGTEVAVEGLTLPLMIEVTADRRALELATLRERLAAEAPGAVYDDHGAWREPLIAWGKGLRRAALAGLALLATATAAAAGLAAAAAVAAAGEAVAVLRLIGARDRLVAGVAARRGGRAALAGAATGAALGLVALAAGGAPGSALPLDLRLDGAEALLALAVPPAAALVAAVAAYATARRILARAD